MALISLSQGFSAPKSRPNRYKARDAAYPTGGNTGYYIAALPKPYPKNAPQKRVSEVAAKCGIKKGMSKSELQKAMVECVGPNMRK